MRVVLPHDKQAALQMSLEIEQKQDVLKLPWDSKNEKIGEVVRIYFRLLLEKSTVLTFFLHNSAN